MARTVTLGDRGFITSWHNTGKKISFYIKVQNVYYIYSVLYLLRMGQVLGKMVKVGSVYTIQTKYPEPPS